MSTPHSLDGPVLPWNKDRIFVQRQNEDSSDPDEKTTTTTKRIKKHSSLRIRQGSVLLSLFLSAVFLSLAEWSEAFVPVVPRTSGRHSLGCATTRLMVPQAKPYTLDQTTKEETLKEVYEPLENERSSFLPSRVEGFHVASPVLSHQESSSVAESSNNPTSDNETSAKRESSQDEDTKDSSSSENDDADANNAETIRGRQVALYRSGVLQKGPESSKRTATERKTSVGDRRVGSATQVRRGIRRTTQLVDAVKQRAQGLSGSRPKPDDDKKNPQDKEAKARLATSRIHTTVEEMLRKTRSAAKTSQSDRFTAAISSWGKSMGILGEEKTNPLQGETLSESPSLVVRVATPMDDVDIANLRLSVFSDFSPEMRSQFCLRSCQALAQRRTSGAVCVVAKPPEHHARSILLGSAECSFHEFQTTRLGQRRPKGSILYITEVAVHPSARRQGIGAKMLQAIDAIASQKGVETLYLHVDVSNCSAMGLYEKCGYRRTNDHDPVFQEFTTSLNLHPGATRGRTHYLLYKNIRVPTWLEEKRCAKETKIVGSLGFEIPA